MATCIHGEENCMRCALEGADFTPSTIHVHVILDISTSMCNRWPQTISGLNEYIEALRTDPNPCKVTITKFGVENEIEDLYTEANLDDIKKFDAKTFYPNGRGTALWGAVGLSLKKIDTTEPVLFVVITDGEDNSSHAYGSEAVNKLVEERQKLGNYTFAYLGVDKAAWGQEAKVAAFAGSNQTMAAMDYGVQTYVTLAGATNALRSFTATNSLGGPSSVSNLFDATSWTNGTYGDDSGTYAELINEKSVTVPPEIPNKKPTK